MDSKVGVQLPEELKNEVLRRLLCTNGRATRLALRLQCVSRGWKARVWDQVKFQVEEMYLGLVESRVKVLADRFPTTLGLLRRLSIQLTSFDEPSFDSDTVLPLLTSQLSPLHLESLELSAVRAFVRPSVPAINIFAARPWPHLTQLKLLHNFSYAAIDPDCFTNLRPLRHLRLASDCRSTTETPSGALIVAIVSNLMNLLALEIGIMNPEHLAPMTQLTSLQVWSFYPSPGLDFVEVLKAQLPPLVARAWTISFQSFWLPSDDILAELIQYDNYDSIRSVLESGFDIPKANLRKHTALFAHAAPMNHFAIALFSSCYTSALALVELSPKDIFAPVAGRKGEIFPPLLAAIPYLWNQLAEERSEWYPYLSVFVDKVLPAALLDHTREAIFGPVLSGLLRHVAPEYLLNPNEAQESVFGPEVAVLRRQTLPWELFDQATKNFVKRSCQEQSTSLLTLLVMTELCTDEEFVAFAQPDILAHLFTEDHGQRGLLLRRIARLIPRNQWKELITTTMHLDLRIGALHLSNALLTTDAVPDNPEVSKVIADIAQRAWFEDFDAERWYTAFSRHEQKGLRNLFAMDTPALVSYATRHFIFDPPLSKTVGRLAVKLKQDPDKWSEVRPTSSSVKDPV